MTSGIEEHPTCAKHPKVETYVTCASCGTPICPKCWVETPVGNKCRDCGTHKSSPIFSITPTQGLAAGGVGLLAGLLGGVLISLLVAFWFYGIILAALYGRFAGRVILRAGGGKMSVWLEVITGVSVFGGGLLARAAFSSALPALLHHAPRMAALQGLTFELIPLGLLVVVTAAAVSQIRYLWFI